MKHLVFLILVISLVDQLNSTFQTAARFCPSSADLWLCLHSHFHKLVLGADAERRVSCVCVCVCVCDRRATLTIWSERGGRTIWCSMVLSTIFHSSLRTRLRTVFSQILANRIRLERKKRDGVKERNTTGASTDVALGSSLLVQQVHEGSQDDLCVHGCVTLVPCASLHLHQLLVHLFDTVLNDRLETAQTW